jgi:hypothetical protein
VTRLDKTCEGPIEGLYLPPFAWKVLDQENIGTIDQLRVTASLPDWLDRIAPKTTQVITLELDRLTSLDDRVAGGGWPCSPWSA